MTPADILATCLAEIEAGRKTAAECLAAYPDMPELAALLAAAQLAREWPAPSLSPAAQQRILAQMRAAAPRQAAAFRLNLQPRLIALVAVIICLVVSVGVGQAAGSSLPGEPLYTVKRATEALRLALAAPAQRPAVYIELGRQRLQEIEALAARGQLTPEWLTVLAADLGATTLAAVQAAEQAAPAAQTWEQVQDLARAEQAVLGSLGVATTAESRPALEAALAAAQSGQTAAERQLTLSDRPPAPSAGATAAPLVRPADTLTATPNIPAPTEMAPAAIGAPPTWTTVKTLNTPTVASSAPEATKPGVGAPAATRFAATELPPGLAKKTEPAEPTTPAPAATAQPEPSTATPEPTDSGPGQAAEPQGPPVTPPGQEHRPTDPPPAADGPPTACPTNPGGQPKCKP
jgi:hypothetical protein